MGRCVPVQPLDLHRDVDQLGNLFIVAPLLAKVFLAFQRLRDGGRIGRVVRDQLGNAVDLRIGHFQHAADITKRGARLKRSEGDDLRHPVEAVFLLNIADDLFPPVLTEIDIEIRHGDAFRVEKPFEQKAPAKRIKVGDRQRPGDHRSRAGATPRPHRDVTALRPLDEVGNNQEIARKAHLVDHAKLEFEPFTIGCRGGLPCRLIHLRGEDMALQPVFQPLFGLALQLAVLAKPGIRGKRRQDRLAGLGHEAATLRDHGAVARRLGKVGEQFRHLGRGLEIMFSCKARAVFLGQLAAVADADKHIMRGDHLAAVETAVIGRHKRKPGGKRRLKKDRLGALLCRQPMPLDLDIETVGKCGFQRGDPVIDKRGLPLGGGGPHEPLQRPAGQQDQPVAILRQRIQPNDRVIAALDLEEGL